MLNLMEYKDIKEIVKDMGESKIDELKIEFPDGTKISMTKKLCIRLNQKYMRW